MNALSAGLIVLIMALNYGISVFNAWSVGKVWAERREAPFGLRLVIYSAAAMSVCGFTWVYLFLLTLGGTLLRGHQYVGKLKFLNIFNQLTDERVHQIFSLGYVIIIPVILGSGLVLTVQAWTVAWRRRKASDFAVAGWDSFAQIYNTAQAIQYLPESLRDVGKLFSSDDEDSSGWQIAIGLVVLALLAGLFTTGAVIRWSARRHADAVLDNPRYHPVEPKTNAAYTGPTYRSPVREPRRTSW
jgi:hypothetical protein